MLNTFRVIVQAYHSLRSIRAERLVYALLVLALFALVLVRAVSVPFVHDEARTFFLYIQSDEMLPFHATWDAANHLLLTSITWPLYKLFGMAPWVLRGFSCASFLLYAWYVHRCGRWIASPTIRWCLWAALLMTPFVLEFFSLFRGYGPSLAFMMMGVHQGVEFLRTDRTAHWSACLVGFALAAYCNLSMLVLWAAVLAGLLVLALRPKGRYKLMRLMLWLLLGVVPLIHAATYAAGLASRDLLYAGSDRGLFNGTLASLGHFVLGCSEPVCLWSVALLFVATIATACWSVRRKRWSTLRSPLVVLSALLLAELMGRSAMNSTWNVLFPTDRAAMHLIPLYLLALGCAMDQWAQRNNWFRFAALSVLYFPLRTAFAMDPQVTTLWPEQSIAPPIIEEIARRNAKSERPLSLATTEFTATALAYEAMWRGLDIPLAQNAPSGSQNDLILIDTKDAAAFPDHRPATRSHGRLQLLERSEPTVLEQVFDTAFTEKGTAFVTLWTTTNELLQQGPVLVEMDALLSSPASPFDAQLTFEVKDTMEHHAYYDGVQLNELRRSWAGDRLHLVRWVPGPLEGQLKFSLYVWDRKGAGVSVDDCRIRIWRPVIVAPVPRSDSSQTDQ